MSYILILTYIMSGANGKGAVAIETVRFESRAACESAGKAWVKQNSPALSIMPDAKYLCAQVTQ